MHIQINYVKDAGNPLCTLFYVWNHISSLLLLPFSVLSLGQLHLHFPQFDVELLSCHCVDLSIDNMLCSLFRLNINTQTRNAANALIHAKRFHSEWIKTNCFREKDINPHRSSEQTHIKHPLCHPFIVDANSMNVIWLHVSVMFA